MKLTTELGRSFSHDESTTYTLLDAKNNFVFCFHVFSATIQVLRFLLAHKADIHLANNDGKTPLFEACARNSVDALRVLITHKASVDAATEQKVHVCAPMICVVREIRQGIL